MDIHKEHKIFVTCFPSYVLLGGGQAALSHPAGSKGHGHKPAQPRMMESIFLNLGQYQFTMLLYSDVFLSGSHYMYGI